MNKTLLTITLLFTTIITLAQTSQFKWAKSFGDSTDEYSHSIAVDKTGNVYSLGFYQGTVDFDPGVGIYKLTSLGAADISIVKLDASGNFVWAKSIGGTLQDDASCIVLDSFGYLYVTGSFQSTVDFNPNSGVNNLTASGFQDIFNLKLDTASNFIWAKNMGGTSTDVGFALTVDNNGNVYTTGIFNNSADFNPDTATYALTSNGSRDIFISKLDSMGNFIWAKNIGGKATDYGYSLKVDALGYVYTTGFFQSTADFDPGAAVFNLISHGADDIYISKLDSSGNFVWAKSMGGLYNDEGNFIHLDKDGNIILVGDFMDMFDFNPNAGVYNLLTAGSYDAYISKFDTSGNLIWAKSVGGGSIDHAISVTSDSAGAIYTIGNFNATCDFDPGTPEVLLQAHGLPDAYILKLDALGNFKWVETFGGPNSTYGRSVALDADENVYSGGYYAGTCDFDETGSNFYLTTKGKNDIFVHKLKPIAKTGIIANGSMNQYNIYPNPSSGIFKITTSNISNHAYVEIYNSLGKLVSSQSIETISTILDLDLEPNGFYFVKLIDGDVQWSKKINKVN